jgi:tRNA A37 threonylcarbamoyladenosine synthetase subunit TsaC/SUA5/YrdC
LRSTGVATTILNARREPPVILRMGALSALEIMKVYDRYLIEGSGR